MADLTELIDAVYRSPEEDGPRLVLADALMEKGQVRGEVIAAQVRGQPLDRRLKAALRRHALDWLGPLRAAVVPKSVVYRRGFVAEATVRFSSPDQVARLAVDPAWSTLEVLSWSREVNAWSKTAPTPLPLLREAREVPDRAMQTLAGRRLPHLEAVSGVVSRGETCDALLDCTGWPSLRRLELSGRYRAAHRLDWLWDCPFASQLDELILVRTRSFPGQGEDRVLDLLAAVDHQPSVPRLVITHQDGSGRRGPTYTFTRGGSGHLDHLDVSSDQPVYRGELERDLHGLPVTDIRMVPGRGWTPPPFEPRPGQWPDRRHTRLPHRRVSAVAWVGDTLAIADHTALLLDTVLEQEAPIEAMATSTDGRFVAVASDALRMYTASGDEQLILPGPVSHLTWTARGLITAAPNGVVRLRDPRGDVLASHDFQAAPYLIAASPGGRLALRHAPGVTRVWWPGEDEPSRVMPGAVERLAWVDDETLLVADPRGILLRWPVEAQGPDRQRRVFEVGLFHQLAWSPDRRHLAVAWSDGETRRARVDLFDPELQRQGALTVGTAEGLCMAWAPDSRRLAIGRGAQVEIRDVETGSIIEWVR